MTGMFPQFIHLDMLFGIKQIDKILRMGRHVLYLLGGLAIWHDRLVFHLDEWGNNN